MKQRGFTLIEVVIAIAILAIIGLASSSVLLQMTRADESSRQQQAAISELQFAFLLMDRDIRQMVARPLRSTPIERRQVYAVNDGGVVDSDMGGMGFVRAGWQNPGDVLPRSQLQPVAYRVRDNVLQRVHAPFVDDASGEPTVQNLLEHVVSFEVVFERAGESFERWSVEGQLPDIVRVKLEHEYLGIFERVLLTSGPIPMGEVRQESGNGSEDLNAPN
ncbi:MULTISPECIES: type II secretion system minor pseudopilin GspJ [Gammaproteobacteria]|uniref:type II secretion system minor pseudopilin GspJ n=1 Tax=Gammaproteobacteria TaxID=1236 RepID=UPI000DD08065|nr:MULTISPECIES: type II secretion system minor pseudopilin GspJ [Gammaproteobacteria]RTE86199.1 type II secretion system protein GspJ [Aliidiomarina sp. B3213]TCZ91551.1 type II secretion system protein GspJ [Lysobacter sp. N42]